MGKYNVVHETDGWTIRTADRLPSAHFEHTIAVRKDKADILSSFDEIEEVIRNRSLITGVIKLENRKVTQKDNWLEKVDKE